MVNPLLLIDVDGVLCPTFGSEPLPGFTFVEVDEIGVWLNPGHGLWLNTLADWYDLVWATTWEDDANRLLGPLLGLPVLPVVEFVTRSVGSTWKLADVARFVEDRAFAWIDDDLGADVTAWAKQRGAPSALVHVDATVGFTEQQFESLRTTAEELTAGSPTP